MSFAENENVRLASHLQYLPDCCVGNTASKVLKIANIYVVVLDLI